MLLHDEGSSSGKAPGTRQVLWLNKRQVIKLNKLMATSPRTCWKFNSSWWPINSLTSGKERKSGRWMHVWWPSVQLYSQKAWRNTCDLPRGQPCLRTWQSISTAPWTLCMEISIQILSLAFSSFFLSFPTVLPHLAASWGPSGKAGLLHSSLQTPVSRFYLSLWFRCFHFLPFLHWPFGLCPLSWLSWSN